MSNSSFYWAAIGAVLFGSLSGFTEVLRVVGKQMILRDAFKVHMAIEELHNGCEDEQIKRITKNILEVIKGRPDNYSAGEYDFLLQIEQLDPNSGQLIDYVSRTRMILQSYHQRLLKARSEERNRNRLIKAFQRLNLINAFVDEEDVSKSTNLDIYV
eukprot:TRINITY_DN5117_c0_g1_i2.p1 TRINITY_DN5117_c0_g1~~TRINITY_DN5117_c0_g1_i2.p1  ORF type:complete len:157 (-),score=38.64 TRINITY_DN5117_c0_g1_i2:57-527(-)